MFILSPHIVDLDAEMLTRLQATRLRNVAEAEKLEDDAEASDAVRRRRDLEREETNARRRERDDAAYERRAAEIDHARALRKIERAKADERLKADKRAWKQIEQEAEQEAKK